MNTYDMLTMSPILEFEKPVVELARKIQDMRSFSSTEQVEMRDEIAKLESKLEKLKKDIHEKLTPWNRVQIARHPKRPYTLDYINSMMTEWVELHGDRAFGDDAAIVTGMAKFNKHPVFVIGQQKGKDVKENIKRNFGMPNPEGYRKALRVMKMAEKFERPVLCFVDTSGAFPGIGAEERGQAEAIARNLREMATLKVPIIVSIIGEGASGGALGIGVGDTVLMLENSWYCVISPEGCAAILWGDRAKAPELAEMMALTADKLKKQGLIDIIVPEPIEGAHRNPDMAIKNLKKVLSDELEKLIAMPVNELIDKRIEKYFGMGVVKEAV